MENKDITILIPAYNPTEDIIPLTDALISNGFKIIVVNDGSNKETSKYFEKLNNDIIFLVHEQNMGKGQALKTGFKYIYDNIPCTGVITVDADGQHLLNDVLNMAKTLNENPSSLIIGSRKQNKEMLLRSRIGNSLTRIVFTIVTGTKVYDTQSGLRGIPYNLIPEFLNISGSRYEYEINVLLYCAKEKINMKEINISTIYIDNNKSSNFNVIKDSIKIYKCILKESNILTSLLYILSAIISFIIDFVLLFLFNMIFNISNADINLLVCVILARIISSIINFTINRTIVFKSKKGLIKSLIEYYLLAVFIIAVNYLILDVLAIKLEINLKLSKIIVELILFIFSYVIQKLYVFKKKNS